MHGSGDLPEEYWKLVDRYRGELVNQAYSILESMEDAEDVVQETFCEAIRKRVELTQAHSLGAWLRSINRANALDRLRGRRRRAQKTSQKQRLEPRRLATTGGFSALELREAVAKAIETLPAPLRTVVVLHFWENLSCDEIAQKLNVSPRTARRMLYEASSHQLFEKLKLYLGGPVPPAAGEQEGGAPVDPKPADVQGQDAGERP